jgi:outer membrane protein assembly factor BamB
MRSFSKIKHNALIGVLLLGAFLIFVSCGKPVGSIEINSTPTGAEVFIDDTTTNQQTNCVLEEVSEGEHTIKLSLSGYSDWDSTVTVEKNEVVSIDAVFSKATGNIQVNSTPKGAAIWLDADSTGQVTDYILVDIPVGSHVVKLTMAGYADWEDTVSVAENQTTTIDAVLERPSGSLIWRYQTGAGIFSSPAVGSDGTIYAGSKDGYLYAVNPDSTLKWRAQTGGEVWSSPAIGSNGIIYVGSMDGSLYAISTADGSVDWNFPTGGPVRSSPAIGSDGTIYVGSYDSQLHAVNPNNTPKWTTPVADTEVILSSPAVSSDGKILVGSGDYLVYALDEVDGSVEWTYSTGGPVSSSPAVGSDGMIYVGSHDGYLYAINAVDGSLRWRYQTSDTVSCSPVIGPDGTIYVGSRDGYLYAINPNNTLKWRQFISAASFNHSPPAVGSDGTIYVGGADHYLYAINTADGSLKWRYDTGAEVNSAPAIGSDGTIYIGAENGYLYAIKGSGVLALGPWPMFHHDLAHTGRVGGGF